MAEDIPASSTRAPRVFISHSHHDKEIAEPLLTLLQLAFRLERDDIRVTSIGGAGLSAGDPIHETLVRDVLECEVLVAVVTPPSLQSSYVQFELGARWGARKPLLPLVAPGVLRAQLPPQIRVLHSVRLDGGVPELIASLSRHLQVPVEPDFIERNRWLIDRARAAAARLYPGAPTPLPFESAVEDPTSLSPDDVMTGARRLWDVIADGGDIFQPDLLVAVNQGGMLASAMLKRWMPAPVGVAFTDLQQSRSVLSIALPEVEQVRRALIVDSKLKSGNSVVNVATELKKRFGCEVRLAVLIAYGPWSGARWAFPNGVRWPAMFRHPAGDLPTYVVYHTAFEGERDLIREAWRDDIILPSVSSSD